jgi:hypothetical protein
MSNEQAKKIRLRSRSSTRRVVRDLRINPDASAAILIPIYDTLPKTMAAGQHNLTYGEIEWPSLKIIASYVGKIATSNSQQKGRFYDLGCGRGRAVLYMALSGLFESSVGIEVLPERISLAHQALTNLKASIPNAGARVRLYEASFLNPSFKYKDASAVFLSNLCFDDQTQTAIFTKLNLEMPKGSLVFCSRVPSTIPSAFESVGIEDAPMTWSHSSHLYILRHL